MFATTGDDGFVQVLPGLRRKTLCHGDATLLTEFRFEAS